MPLKRSTFEVWVNIEGRELVDGMPPDHVVTVTHGDMLVAERQAIKLNMRDYLNSAPMETSTLWVWAAMARLQLTQLQYHDWKTQELAELGKPQVVDVDPTQQAASTG